MDFLLLLPLLSVCLLSCSGTTSGETDVSVEEGSDVVLPCLIKPKRDLTGAMFDWRKDGQVVFYYENGLHHNEGLTGQDEHFKGRVFHFPDQVEFSNASIKIRDTTMSDSGTYICDYAPKYPSKPVFYINLVVVPAVVRVEEGSEAVLRCFIRPRRDIRRQIFDWRKVGQGDAKKKVFMYKKGQHYNNGLTGQSEQFKGRVSHFSEQLQSGGASIVIRDTKQSDNGTYTCEFSPGQSKSQKIYIYLVVGACPNPYVTALEVADDEAVVQCEVRDVYPEPKVNFQDSSGNILTAEEPQVTERGDSYDIILNTTVTKPDNYSCVVTQEKICYQFSEKIFVNITDPNEGPKKEVIIGGGLGGLLVLVLIVLMIIFSKKGPEPEAEGDEQGDPDASDNLEQPQSA